MGILSADKGVYPESSTSSSGTPPWRGRCSSSFRHRFSPPYVYSVRPHFPERLNLFFPPFSPWSSRPGFSLTAGKKRTISGTGGWTGRPPFRGMYSFLSLSRGRRLHAAAAPSAEDLPAAPVPAVKKSEATRWLSYRFRRLMEVSIWRQSLTLLLVSLVFVWFSPFFWTGWGGRRTMEGISGSP